DGRERVKRREKRERVGGSFPAFLTTLHSLPCTRSPPVHRLASQRRIVGEERIDAGVEQGAHFREAAGLVAMGGITAFAQRRRQERVLGTQRVYVHFQPCRMRIAHQRGGCAEATIL